MYTYGIIFNLGSSAIKKDEKEEEKIQRKSSPKLMKHGKTNKIVQQQCVYNTEFNANNRNGNNGQIQLWQFLLELLTTKDYENIIHWTGIYTYMFLFSIFNRDFF